MEGVSRRDFLNTLAKYSLALGLSPLVASLLIDQGFAGPIVNHQISDAKAGASLSHKITQCEVWHYNKLPGKKIQCFVCPLNCVLNDGETCFCRTRTNYGGTLYNDAYNNPCIIAVEPVEKGPFSHVLPGTDTFALGTAGCNLRCVFCQNWQLSQKTPQETKNFFLSQEMAVEKSLSEKCRSLTYTYTEPVVFFEYVYRVAELAQQHGLKNLIATAGFVNEKPLRDWCQVIDGFVVSIKAYDEKFYTKICGQAMAPVLKALEVIKNQGKWLELVYVIIPTVNDDMNGIKKLVGWIKGNLGSNVPLHFARFFPAYQLANLPRTPLRQLEEAMETAHSAGLRYVYLNNVPGHKANTTYCPDCGKPLIERVGFKQLTNKVKKGRCAYCDKPIDGLWA